MFPLSLKSFKEKEKQSLHRRASCWTSLHQHPFFSCGISVTSHQEPGLTWLVYTSDT